MKRRDIFIIFLAILFALAFPFILAAMMAKPDHIFIGFLLNPIDGASYLAKMYTGWIGDWRFTLPFSAERSPGAYLFLYYIFLGHLARWFQLPLLIVFHLARIISSGFLLYSLFLFYGRVFPARPDLIRNAFLLSAIGSGMGWLLVFGGHIPFDFWVAEAYPFLSMYSNPHFPAGLGLLILSILFLLEPSSFLRNLKLFGAGLAIAIIYPFGQVVAITLTTGWLVWNWFETRHFDWTGLACLGIPGGAFLLYQFIAIQQDPLLAGWNSQNITLMPNAWDVFLSLSPVIMFAVVGGWWLIKQKNHPVRPFLILWPVIGLFLAYLPVTLQRRFTFGLFLPLAALAVFGIDAIQSKSSGWGKRLMVIIFVLSVPTNLLLVSSGMLAAGSHPPMLYLTRDEAQVLTWIKLNLPQDAIILASPEMSLVIPAMTGRRIVYAHPFETVNAAELERDVLSFYQQSGWSDNKSAVLSDNHVDYVIFGPRELRLGESLDISQFQLLSQSGKVKIFAVHQSQ